MRVWPWGRFDPWRRVVKKIILFEKPYMTSYLTSMDTMRSLSGTVFEIFDFKIFRVSWNKFWPLKDHPGQKKMRPFERAYSDFLWLLWAPCSLSRTRFRDIWLQRVFREFDLDLWPLEGHLGLKKIYRHSKDRVFLFDFYDTISTMVGRFRMSSTEWKFEGFDGGGLKLDLWPLGGWSMHVVSKENYIFERTHCAQLYYNSLTINQSTTVLSRGLTLTETRRYLFNVADVNEGRRFLSTPHRSMFGVRWNEYHSLYWQRLLSCRK